MNPSQKCTGYHRPENMEEALGLLSEYGNKARVIAGGTDILSLGYRGQKKSRQAILIDISQLGLNFIKNTKDSICIGAATDINTIADSFLMTSSPGVLSEAALAHSTYTIRNRATIGGNLCNASPCADMTLPLLVLDAALVAVRKNDSRTILVQDFFCGVNCSALKPDQMLQKIVIPLPSKFFGASFLKLGRHQTAVDMAIVNVATSLWRKKEKCTAARIALGSVGPIAFRAKSAEAWLSGKKLNNKNIQQAAKMAADESNPIDDNRATGKYRKEMAAVLVEKSLETSLQRSGQ